MQLRPKALLIMEHGTGGRCGGTIAWQVRALFFDAAAPPRSLDGLLARTTLVTFNWLQRVTLGVGVASGVACASLGVQRATFCRVSLTCVLLPAVLHAQQPPIIHLDLKSQNVVLDAALSPKICDFGISLLANDTKTITHGSPMYMAPEVARREAVTNRALSFPCLLSLVVCTSVVHLTPQFPPPFCPGPAVNIYGLGCSAFRCAIRERELKSLRSLSPIPG